MKNHKYIGGKRLFMNVDKSLIGQWGFFLQIDVASIAIAIYIDVL